MIAEVERSILIRGGFANKLGRGAAMTKAKTRAALSKYFNFLTPLNVFV